MMGKERTVTGNEISVFGQAVSDISFPVLSSFSFSLSLPFPFPYLSLSLGRPEGRKGSANG